MTKASGKGACPVCNKPAQTAYRPFCSRRCADVDLNRWLGEGYRIPTDDVPDPDDPALSDPETENR